MTSFIIVDITTSKKIAMIEAKSLHAAKCIMARKYYGQFHRVYQAE